MLNVNGVEQETLGPLRESPRSTDVNVDAHTACIHTCTVSVTSALQEAELS